MADILSAIEFLKKLRSEQEVVIKFIKKDGNTRLMRCTLDFKKIPKENLPKGVNLPQILNLIQKNILRVYDLDVSGWRSIPFDRTEWLETPTKQRFYMKERR
jgi:hypothetical protein